MNATQLTKEQLADLKREFAHLMIGDMSPKELFECIKKYKKNFDIEYNPDYRQKIADTWPESIDDSYARNDWGWKESFNLDKMTKEIILNLKS